MGLTYKAEIRSMDGSTKLGNFIFTVPSATKDGTGKFNASGNYYDSYGAWALALAGYQNSLSLNVSDLGMTFLYTYTPNTLWQASALMEMGVSIGNLYPYIQNNNKIRLKFNNGCYIMVTPTVSNDITYASFEYFLANNTSLGSINNIYMGGSINTTQNSNGNGVTLPFVVANADGTVTDYHPRYTTIGLLYYPSAAAGYKLMTSGYSDVYLASNTSINLRLFYQGMRPADPDNPYDPGGPSEPGDGEPGNFSDESDDVEEDTLPTISAVGTGMATIFSPTTTQLKNLSDIFWGNQWWTVLQNTVEGIDKMFVSLGIVPFEVTTGSTVEVTWLGLAITEVFLTLAAQQYYEFDMGSINLANDTRIYTSGSALDYSPFSKLGIYLPFIGYQELDVDEFRGATINLVYRIDILSGTSIALIKINGNTIYQFTGNCMTQIPITSQSFETMITNAVNVGIAVSGVRSASAVGAAAGDVAAAQFDVDKITPEQAQLALTKSRAHVEGGVDRLLSACANSIMGLKPNYDKSGAVSNSASLLAVKQPFLFLTTPRQCIPQHYQRYSGFPSNITRKIGECSGYLVVENIRLNNLVATSKEVEEIYDLLKSGVIV